MWTYILGSHHSTHYNISEKFSPGFTWVQAKDIHCSIGGGGWKLYSMQMKYGGCSLYQRHLQLTDYPGAPCIPHPPHNQAVPYNSFGQNAECGSDICYLQFEDCKNGYEFPILSPSLPQKHCKSYVSNDIAMKYK